MLEVDNGKAFHIISAELLYVCNRASLDLKLPIAFLRTRVSKSTIQDWGKLKRVLLGYAQDLRSGQHDEANYLG